MINEGVGDEAVLCVALQVERLAVRRAAASMRLLTVGMGARRGCVAAIGAGRGPLLVTGVAGALVDGVRPGDLVVADSLLAPVEPGGERARAPSRIPVPRAERLAAALRRAGLVVHVGAVATARGIVDGVARERVAGCGAVAVDMESYLLAAAAPERPLAVVRAVVDTPDRPLRRAGTVLRGVAALRSLRRAVPVLEEWALEEAALPSRSGEPAHASPLPQEVV